jgi:hypothetical protein
LANNLDRTVTFKIPASIPNGEYLFRPEHIAVMAIDNPQIYTTCAQISVYGGGNGTPGPLVSIPGLYKESDPTWKYDIRKIVSLVGGVGDDADICRLVMGILSIRFQIRVRRCGGDDGSRVVEEVGG